jgi:hypothetical protein
VLLCVLGQHIFLGTHHPRDVEMGKRGWLLI